MPWILIQKELKLGLRGLHLTCAPHVIRVGLENIWRRCARQFICELEMSKSKYIYNQLWLDSLSLWFATIGWFNQFPIEILSKPLETFCCNSFRLTNTFLLKFNSSFKIFHDANGKLKNLIIHRFNFRKTWH